MPMYRTKFLIRQSMGGGAQRQHQHEAFWWFEFTIIKEKTNKLGFELYLVDVNGLLDREKVYGYNDDNERFTAFQIVCARLVECLG